MPRNSKFDNEEEWFLFREGKYHYYYVSNKGRVKYKYKKSKIENKHVVCARCLCRM